MPARPLQQDSTIATTADTPSLDAARATKRVASYDWGTVGAELTTNGCAVLPKLLQRRRVPGGCRIICGRGAVSAAMS